MEVFFFFLVQLAFNHRRGSSYYSIETTSPSSQVHSSPREGSPHSHSPRVSTYGYYVPFTRSLLQHKKSSFLKLGPELVANSVPPRLQVKGPDGANASLFVNILRTKISNPCSQGIPKAGGGRALTQMIFGSPLHDKLPSRRQQSPPQSSRVSMPPRLCECLISTGTGTPGTKALNCSQ